LMCVKKEGDRLVLNKLFLPPSLPPCLPASLPCFRRPHNVGRLLVPSQKGVVQPLQNSKSCSWFPVIFRERREGGREGGRGLVKELRVGRSTGHSPQPSLPPSLPRHPQQFLGQQHFPVHVSRSLVVRHQCLSQPFLHPALPPSLPPGDGG
jgi:hypothetical protein